MATESGVRSCYCAMRSRIPTLGVQATLLHVGDERTGIVTGSGAAPEASLMLEIGSRRLSREHFRPLSPTEGELERAIVTIEDELARAGPMLRRRSTLYTTDDVIRQIATTAGVPVSASMNLGLEAVEQTFGRFVAETLGQSRRSSGFPLDRQSTATLLILREFMHHLQFGSINVVLPPMPMAPSGRRSNTAEQMDVRLLRGRRMQLGSGANANESTSDQICKCEVETRPNSRRSVSHSHQRRSRKQQ